MAASREIFSDRFRRVHNVQSNCLKKKTAYFIQNHESSTTIHHIRTNEDLLSVLVFTDKEGADEIYVYIYNEEDFKIGDYFTWNGYTFFAYEKVEVVKDVDFLKFKALQCNVFVNETFWAYFISSLRSAKDVKMSKDYEQSSIVPLLIAPINEELSIGGRINFNNQIWDIEDGDIYTITGIGYYSLTRGLNSRDEEEIDIDSYPYDDYYIGSNIVVNTENGFYSSDQPIKLIKREENKITFSPLQAGTLKVTVLNNNDYKIITYTVKEYA